MEQAPSLVGDNGRCNWLRRCGATMSACRNWSSSGRRCRCPPGARSRRTGRRLGWTLGVNDLGARIRACRAIQGHRAVSGTPDNLSSTRTSTAASGRRGCRPGNLTAHIAIEGLPAKPRAQITAKVRCSMHRSTSRLPCGARERHGWRSTYGARAGKEPAGERRLELPSRPVPTGNVHVAMTRAGGSRAPGRTADRRQHAGGARCHRGQAASDFAGARGLRFSDGLGVAQSHCRRRGSAAVAPGAGRAIGVDGHRSEWLSGALDAGEGSA